MTKLIVALAAVVMLAACSQHGNSHIDYRATSFSTVNHCLHNSRFC